MSVKVMTSIDEFGHSMGVIVTTSSATVGHWRQLAEQAAHALYSVAPAPTDDRERDPPVDRVMFQFDAASFTSDLVDQAREAFLARWKQLVDRTVAP